MYKNILITGGAGFVGSNLALSFKRDYPAAKVVALDNLKRRGSELNLPRLREGGVEFVHGDIRNREDLEDAGKFDFILECSAEPSVLAGYDKAPDYLINTNLMGTVNCLEAARKYQADMIFLSTSRVYPIHTINQLDFQEMETRFELASRQSTPGVSGKGISESFPLEGPRSLYGTTKLCSELIFEEYISMYGLRGIINRCGVLTGPWQMGKVDQGIVVYWVARHIFGGELAYFGYGGTGKQVRDILHIDDLYQLLIIQIDDLQSHNGQVYNVGGGREISVSLKELTHLCRQATGKTLEVKPVLQNRRGDIPIYLSDCTKVTHSTRWQPRQTPEKIVEEIARWITDHQAQLKPILS